jgi:protein-L-isoaspartate(D-aspartate) O-methyltransferase
VSTTSGGASLDATRAAYAETIANAAAVHDPRLRDALAKIPRERYLRAGPWTMISTAAGRQAPVQTPDADPQHVYQDASVAIDADRQLFNGAPSFLVKLIERLSLDAGHRVLHVGAGLGYYSALMADVVGPTGRVVAVEADEVLAGEARTCLSDMPNVDVVHGDGTAPAGPFDAILVNAGVTHPDESWLDSLAPGGRLLVPLTVAMPGMGATIGKGVMLSIARRQSGEFLPDVISFVAIYSAIGLRDAAIEAELGQALRRTSFPNLTRLRRDSHPRTDACWLHAERFCFSMEPV